MRTLPRDQPQGAAGPDPQGPLARAADGGLAAGVAVSPGLDLRPRGAPSLSPGPPTAVAGLSAWPTEDWSPGDGSEGAEGLQELLQRVEPDEATARRWIELLEQRLGERGSDRGPPQVRPQASPGRAGATTYGKSSPGAGLSPRLSFPASSPASTPRNPRPTTQDVHPEEPNGHGDGEDGLNENRRLPARLVCAITLVIPTCVAVVNNIIVWSDGYLFRLKLQTTQHMTSTYGPSAGALSLTVMSAALALAACSLVVFVAPNCAGSGLPEAKGFLNGNKIGGVFKFRALVVRILGMILALAAGFPVGREGPMVGIGGTLGYGVATVLALPWARQWVTINSSWRRSHGQKEEMAPIVDEERFAQVKRHGFILGGAAGISTAFDAPVGGILYMFEEATMTAWPPVLTFRTFVSSVCAALISRAMFNVFGQDVHRLLIYVSVREDRGSWDWKDVPFFMLLSSAVGFLSVVFTKMLLAVWSARMWCAARCGRWKPYLKILECVSYAIACALIFYLTPLMVECVKDDSDEEPHVSVDFVRKNGAHRGKTLAHSLKFIHHNCPPGQTNEVATLLLKGCEGTVKHLFARDTHFEHLGSLGIVLALYTLLAAGMAGLAVPMGNFLPSMLIGALCGRLMGETLRYYFGMNMANAGVYALVGSAAMLSGFTHMTIAVVVILVEASQDLSLVSPLMLSIVCSHLVSTSLSRHNCDEALILRKGVPFLDAELPADMDRTGLVAGDLCEGLHSDALLPPEATPTAVQKALERLEVENFPIIEDGICIGLAPRARLEAIVRMRGAYLPPDARTPKILDDGIHMDDAVLRLGEDEDDEFALNQLMDRLGVTSPHRRPAAMPDQHVTEEGLVPVRKVMDPSPYILLEDMPAQRLYPIFARMSTVAACVTSRRGEFRGLLSRVNLISAASQVLRPPKRNSRGGGPLPSAEPRQRRYGNLP